MFDLPMQLPDENTELALLKWLDSQRLPLMALQRVGNEQELRILEVKLPTLKPLGQFVTVPGSGASLYAGYHAIIGEDLVTTLGCWAASRLELRGLEGQVKYDAIRARFVEDESGTRRIANFTQIEHAWQGSAALGSRITVTHRPQSAYVRAPLRFWPITPGQDQDIVIGGHAPCDLIVTITAGASSVVNPQVITDNGLTTWHGTVLPGRVLTIDGQRGRVDLDDQDVSLRLTGLQPQLQPGRRTVRINAAGASAEIQWQEGFL